MKLKKAYNLVREKTLRMKSLWEKRRVSRRLNTQSTKGISAIYDELQSDITWTLSEGSPLVTLPFLSISPVFVLYFFASLSLGINLVSIIAAFLVSSLLSTYVMFFVILGIFILRNPLKRVPNIATKLIAVIRKPYSDSLKVGLNLEEILQIKRIAEIEQSSADWRGSIISVFIIGSLSFFLAGIPFLNEISTDTSIDELEKISEAIFNVSYPGWIRFMGNAYILITVSLALIGFAIFMIRFFITESANRTILLACEEAKLLLKRHHLGEKENITLADRISLISSFGYLIKPSSQTSLFDKLLWGGFCGPDGKWWLVIRKKDNQWKYMRK
jgi:hypothetical protein